MSPRVVHCEQGSPEWLRARMGMPTASAFKYVMATPRGESEESRTRAKYMRQLAYEIVSGEPMTSYVNEVMERGRAMEPEAMALYMMMRDVVVEKVGFIVNGKVGASPDGLVTPQSSGPSGGIEIKTEQEHLLIKRLVDPGAAFPSEHVAQCMGNMWVCEREWWDLAVYWPRLPLFTRRLKRDDRYIARLEIGVEAFLEELDDVVARVRAHGGGAA